jgi:hypothetical protein
LIREPFAADERNLSGIKKAYLAVSLLFSCVTSIPQRFPLTPWIRATRQRRFTLRILDPHDGLGAAGHVDFIHCVALVFQRLNQRRAELALFQFGRAIAAAEVGQADGALRVEVPVEQADQWSWPRIR